MHNTSLQPLYLDHLKERETLKDDDAAVEAHSGKCIVKFGRVLNFLKPSSKRVSEGMSEVSSEHVHLFI